MEEDRNFLMPNIRENSRKKKLNETSLSSAALHTEPAARNPPAPGDPGGCASTTRPRLRGSWRCAVRPHRRPRPGTAYLPRFLTSSPPGRGPRRARRAGQGRAKPPLTTISPGVPRRSRRGRRALPGADSPLPAGTTPAAGILRGTTGGPLPVPLIPPELPEQGWQQARAVPRRGAPMPPAGSASIRRLAGRRWPNPGKSGREGIEETRKSPAPPAPS